MMLTINSLSITLKSLRITASQELASEDASGQSSSTDQAETGIKAKMLAVSGFLPFTQAEHLAQLFAMAEATESALGVKQVRFSSKIEAVEQQTTRQWAISFTLVEYRSVPEKVEERTPQAEANQQGGKSNVQYANIGDHLQKNFESLRTV
mgnify:CR=1 FL=1